MKLQPVLLSSKLVLASIALGACSDQAPDDRNMNEGGSVATAGTASGGSGPAGGSGIGGSGIGIAGAAIAGTGTGGTPGGGASAAGSSSGGSATAGSGGGATTGGVGETGPLTGSAEDDGADCQVGTLPAAGSLTAIAKLPDPFEKLDGTRITTKAEWRCRRQEIKKLAEAFAYGVKPPKPQTVMGTVSSSTITIKVTENGKSASFSATVKLPTGGSAPYPAIVVYGGAGFGAPLDSSVINGEGVALINYDPYVVGKETGQRSPKAGAFYDIYGSDSKTGLLVAWGWGVSRIIDAIEQSDGKLLKADAVGVTGCSRFGKGSFIAGVFDQRVALTMPIESGSAGVPTWRGIPGEGAQSLSSAYGEQPWFGDAFSAFTGSPTKAPIDTHESVAMVAPRGLFIMDNPSIANLGPKSAHVAALAGAEVYKALGAGANISYVSAVADGNHCAQRPEWSTPLKNSIQKFLKKTGSAPGVIAAASKATGDLATWREWDTPTLN
jgi:hypothetical protein